MIIGPLLSAGFDALSEAAFGGSVGIGGLDYELPGVRLTLWLDALLIIVAGVLARLTVRSAALSERAAAGSHPAAHVHTRAVATGAAAGSTTTSTTSAAPDPIHEETD